VSRRKVIIDGQEVDFVVIQSDATKFAATVIVTREGTPTRIDTTTSKEIVAAPGTGYKLILCGFVISVDADEIVRLRWNGATGPIIAMLPTKGVIGMNLVGVNEESAENVNLYLEKTGTGNAQGTVWTKKVSV